MAKLLSVLEDAAPEQLKRQKGWPKSASALSAELRRIAPNLRKLDPQIIVEFTRSRQARTVIITRGSYAERPKPSWPSSASPRDGRDAGDGESASTAQGAA